MAAPDPNSVLSTSTLPAVEVGFVSRSTALRDFLVEVFGLEPLPPIDLPIGVLYPLRCQGTALKVFVPMSSPNAGPRTDSFFEVEGLRFLTIRVTDIAGVFERAVAGGARIVRPPAEAIPGVWSGMMLDLDGNALEVSESRT